MKVEVFKKITQNEKLLHTYYNENDEAQINDCKVRLKGIYEQTEQLPELIRVHAFPIISVLF